MLTAILTVVMASAAIAGCSSAPEETEVQAKTTGAETKKSEETTSAGENEEKDTTKIICWQPKLEILQKWEMEKDRRWF